MPKRTDIKRILIIGSGPIVIGQACEFDYSGAQACKVLMQDGYEVILVNSNPATIMTDPAMATRTYVEPITKDSVARIIASERPDALLPTLGGQTGLNCAVELAQEGILEKYNVQMIGCDLAAIQKGEDRKLFAEAMAEIGLECARSGYAYTIEDAEKLSADLSFPLVLRPSFTLGGAGGGIAHDINELREIVAQGLDLSPAGEVLVEESIIGWKEYEMEVMRDKKGNGIIVCSIENVDAMGVHTGDSITVAPAMTLTDMEYQRMRVASLAILEKIGVETGGSNVQFAVNPKDGRMIVIEMNPRVSRSSALASKATGFPIAKFAAKLAVGYTLDEMLNDVTKATPACFEPSIDYVVVKVPRFAFEKFKGTDTTLTTHMKAVGEIMAIGRTFEEALGKAMRSLENGRGGLGFDGKDDFNEEHFDELVARPTEHRLYYIAEALHRGWSVERVASATGIDKWFVHRIKAMVDTACALEGRDFASITAEELKEAKRKGLSDIQIAWLLSSGTPQAELAAEHQAKQALHEANLETQGLKTQGLKTHGLKTQGVRTHGKVATPIPFQDGNEPRPEVDDCNGSVTEHDVRALRKRLGVLPVFKMVDTCAAEFASQTAYYYKTYESKCDAVFSTKPKAMILGAGPNRIGQGIEFDYCCVHASYALANMGFETIMVNCNPETVSTDYDTSDRLYFEPLTFEDVMDIVDVENPDGVVVTLGGQTPLKLAWSLDEAGVNIMGTQPKAIDLAEDRERFAALLDRLDIAYPPADTAASLDEALEVSKRLGFPLLVRPSYVLGGRGMVIAYASDYLKGYMAEATLVSPDHPVYLDHFLEGAIELDVDALCDGKEVYIGGLLEHIEEAGIHSGDSSCCTPPFSISRSLTERICEYTSILALEIGVRGLVNVQFAIKDTEVYVIEVNPRASRTVPFTSKATGVPLAKCAARIMAGESIASLRKRGLPKDRRDFSHFSVKEAVMPFGRFPGADIILGPEMKSTGEVMGIGESFPVAYAKAALSIDYSLPTSGTAFISVCDRDKRSIAPIAHTLHHLGFKIVSTAGTAYTLRASGVPVEEVRKVQDASPNIGDLIASGEIALMINTPFGKETRNDAYLMRTAAVRHGICYATTIAGAGAMVRAIEVAQRDLEGANLLSPIALQDLAQWEV
ncbi:MAG: carbamoyl-phosphate synthase large subunit [Coriobacteriales bacterium]|jgi:carbamoyl-phosphate synthase large subunit|nr:carbamoyl-phosphate synthase large subunit [Coriobacteriales bacterium]